MSTRKEQFAAAAVTGLTSGAGQGVVSPAQIAKQAFEIAAQLEAIFAATDGAPVGAQVVVNLQAGGMPQPSIAPFAQYGQPQGGAAPQQYMPPVMGRRSREELRTSRGSHRCRRCLERPRRRRPRVGRRARTGSIRTRTISRTGRRVTGAV